MKPIRVWRGHLLAFAHFERRVCADIVLRASEARGDDGGPAFLPSMRSLVMLHAAAAWAEAADLDDWRADALLVGTKLGTVDASRGAR